MRRTRWIAAAGAALAVVGLALAASRPPASAEPEDERDLLPVEVDVVQRVASYSVASLHAGRVVNRRTSDLGFDRSGRLDEVVFDEGDRVQAGDVLAHLDTRELVALRRQAVARVNEIDARLRLARLTTERHRALRESDHMAQQKLDEASFDEQAIAAELQAARAAVENLEVRLELSEIRAPYAGQISDRFADEGTIVGPGEPILRLVEDGALEVQIGVPPDAVAALDVGSRHALEIDGREHPAVLDAVLSTIEPDTRTVRAVFHLEGSPAGVNAGSLARLRLETEVAGSGFWLPLTALAESRRGLWSAYAVVEDGEGLRVERRQLEVIHAADDRAFVRGTLRDGERVVATGIHRLVPGQRVRIVTAVAADR